MFKEFFVSFYKGRQHVRFYKLAKTKQEVVDFLTKSYGEPKSLDNLVIDRVI